MRTKELRHAANGREENFDYDLMETMSMYVVVITDRKYLQYLLPSSNTNLFCVSI